MSSRDLPPPRHQIGMHTAARKELQNTPTDVQSEIKHIINEASLERNPITHRKLDDMEGCELFKFRVRNYRALLDFTIPHLVLVRVGPRRTVYDDLSVAVARAEELRT